MFQYTDAQLDALFDANLLCQVCEAQPHTQFSQYSAALVCADCASNEPEPEENAEPDTEMVLEIRYSTGHTATTDTLQAALDMVRHAYPAAHFVTYDGWAVESETEAANDSLQTGRILAWPDEDASENDAGARAIASIALLDTASE